MTSLDKKEFRFACKRRALQTSEVRGQLIDGGFLPITAIDDALISMGKDTADEAVFAIVVHALVFFQGLTDCLRCGVFVMHYLKMKLAKGAVQSLWKVKYRKSYYTTRVPRPQPELKRALIRCEFEPELKNKILYVSG